ncbi:nucleoside diphosphate kinase [Bacteroidia bacterium]|nr:nucleoside diphosphate kinase [Bacteroidia bacterium]
MERTLTIIKPNAVAAGASGRILDRLIAEEFVIVALKMIFLSRNDASRFYAVHRGRAFFADLVDFMTSGPVIVAVLEREDAVARLRRVVGDTDPPKAAEGTIRRLFGVDKTQNAIHASDSAENACAEWRQFFAEEEIMIP